MLGLVLLNYMNLRNRRVVNHLAYLSEVILCYIYLCDCHPNYNHQLVSIVQSPSIQHSLEISVPSSILGIFFKLLRTLPPLLPMTTIMCSFLTSAYPLTIKTVLPSFTHYYSAGSSAFTMPVSSPTTHNSPDRVCTFIYSTFTHKVIFSESGVIYFTFE